MLQKPIIKLLGYIFDISGVSTFVLLLTLKLFQSQKCWAGTCLLGVTIEECTSERLIASYSLWFEKLLQNIQVFFFCSLD
jgi:rRNA processing/ribosome biogenesis